MRAAALALGLIAGCGRIAFDPLGAAGDGAIDGPADPAVELCAEVRLPISGLEPDLDLAATAIPDGGIVALWLNRAAVEPVRGVQFDANYTALGGTRSLFATGTALPVVRSFWGVLYGIAVGTTENHFTAAHDLTSSMVHNAVPMPGVPNPDCAMQSQSGRYATASAAGSTVRVQVVVAVGSFSGSDTGTAPAPLQSIACSDATDHVHVVAATSAGRCVAATIDLPGGAPSVGAFDDLISDDCRQPRATFGQPGNDEGGLIWTTSAGAVVALVYAATRVERVLSSRGRAPKIAFDGSRDYWAAWIDTRGDSERLYAARFDLLSSTGPLVVPGPLPLGDEAFELVANGNGVHLVMLDADGLRVSRLCAP